MLEQKPSRDFGFYVVLSLVGLVAVWLLMTPLVPAVAKSTMNRFHLRTESFPVWAAQQVIPSMYNFGNTIVIHDTPPGMLDPFFYDVDPPQFLNHFPARRLTFGDGRGALLQKDEHKWLEMRSSYRGAELETWIHAKPVGDGVYEMVRIDDQESPLP